MLPPAYDRAVDVEEARSAKAISTILRRRAWRNMPHLLAYAYEQMHLATRSSVSWMVVWKLCIGGAQPCSSQTSPRASVIMKSSSSPSGRKTSYGITSGDPP